MNNNITKSVKRTFSKKQYENFIWRDERIADQQQSDRIINEKKKGKQAPLSRSIQLRYKEKHD